MPQSVKAIYENGILRPLHPLRGIAEHTEVRLVIRDAASSALSLAESIGILPEEDAEMVIRGIEKEFAQADRSDPSHFTRRETPPKLASFLRLVASLTDLDQLKAGWNTYEAPSPSLQALVTALRVLGKLYFLNYLPDRVLSMADGGVAFVYNQGCFYANIECFNDGEITAGLSNRSDYQEAWDVTLDTLEDSVRRIKAFLNG